MKRKNFRYRALPLPSDLAGPIEDPNVFCDPSTSGQREVRARRIFVTKQVRRLPSTTANGEELQHILIFDDHPDSLRLVFGRSANTYFDPSFRLRAGLLTLVVIMGGLSIALLLAILSSLVGTA